VECVSPLWKFLCDAQCVWFVSFLSFVLLNTNSFMKFNYNLEICIL
jgi:hypothetical protein